MTEKQLWKLVAVWAKRLGLHSWHIDVRIEAASDESCYMETERSTYYERGSIIVQPWVLGRGKVPEGVVVKDLTDEFIECSVVHELLHLALRDLAMVVRDDLDGLLHRDVFGQVDNAFRRAEEQAVDRTAVALVRAWKRS